MRYLASVVFKVVLQVSDLNELAGLVLHTQSYTQSYHNGYVNAAGLRS